MLLPLQTTQNLSVKEVIMKTLLGFIFFTCTSFIFSQENDRITVIGLVSDANNNPISNANISIIGSSKGTKTDENGTFYLIIQQKSTTLKVSHISYYTKNKMLLGNAINDTLHITIQLTKKTNELETFEISSEKIELLYNKPFIPIYDYQFYYEHILLLLKEENTTKLKLIDNNQKVAQELVVGNEFKSLFKDCYGNTHLLSSDSAYQIYIDVNTISILYQYPITKFNESIKHAITKTNDKIIFNHLGLHNQSVEYYYLTNNKNKGLLKKIKDNQAEKYATQTIIKIKSLETILEKRSLGAGLMAEGISSNRIGKIIFQETNMYNKVLTKPLYSPLFKIDDKVLIFDHVNDSCFIYDEDLNLNSIFPINYHYLDGWKKELIVDKEQGDVYAKFEKNGLCYLKKIDLTTGKIIESFKLEKHTFPTNIKIRNNTAYYLYKNHFNHGQMSLYKQGLY